MDKESSAKDNGMDPRAGRLAVDDVNGAEAHELLSQFGTLTGRKESPSVPCG